MRPSAQTHSRIDMFSRFPSVAMDQDHCKSWFLEKTASIYTDAVPNGRFGSYMCPSSAAQAIQTYHEPVDPASQDARPHRSINGGAGLRA